MKSLYLIDATGPFFRGYRRPTINWSKIPWDHVELDDPDKRREQFRAIRDDFRGFCRRVRELGYNAITLDDLAHLADHEHYEPEVRERIRTCRSEFGELFAIARTYGLRVLVTMDVLSYTPRLRELVGGDPRSVREFLGGLIDSFFESTPEVAGLILRVGESDAKDVDGDFKSELHLKSVRMVRRFLRHVLPVFERHGRKLVFRTWTVGAHRIGDLIWHRSRFLDAFSGIESSALIISMKYGESDFFRFLPLNTNFFRSDHAKIIELQARREYEGCGEFPAFIGSDCERYARELESAKNVVGISVWCQTGGWVPFRRLAFLDGGEGIWTEANAAVALRVFKHGELATEAARHFATDRRIADPDAFVELLQLSEGAVEDLLYIREFAQQKLFFRRVRIPPLLNVYWNNLFINHSTRKLLRHFVTRPEKALAEAEAALESIRRMRELALHCGVPVDDIDFMYDTFQLLALAREYCFLPYSDKIRRRIKEQKRAYKKRWPKKQRPRFRIRVDYRPFKVRRRHLGWAIAFGFRRRRGYRLLDHLFTLHLLGFIYRFATRRRPDLVPEFARDSAMGIDAVFK